MPHQFLHDFEFDSEASEQRAVGVAKRMPTNALLNTQLFGNRLNVMAHNCRSPIRLLPIVQSTGEHPIVTGLEFALLFPRDQRRGKL
jgi:hypothetical protein